VQTVSCVQQSATGCMVMRNQFHMTLAWCNRFHFRCKRLHMLKMQFSQGQTVWNRISTSKIMFQQ